MFIPELNKKQIDRLSEIYMSIGLIAMASVAIPALIDKFNTSMLIWGLLTAIGFWLGSLYILRRKS